MHGDLQPNWYLEIGSATGDSLKLARCNANAIDPDFQISSNIIGLKKSLGLFQQTSDQFFESGFLKKLDITIGFAFVDGSHLIEDALRDLLHIEEFCTESSMVLLHDCCPTSFEMAERTWDRSKSSWWTGDVWKLVPALLEFRPDLQLEIYDSFPTGLLRIRCSGTPPQDRFERYSEMVAKYRDLPLDPESLASFYDSSELRPADQFQIDKPRL